MLPPFLLDCRQAAAGDVSQGNIPEVLHVADFRSEGMNDRQVLERAFRAWTQRGGGTLHLERDRVYDLGSQRDGSNVFVIFGLRDAILAGNGATLRIHSDVHEYFNLLYLAHYQNFRIENLSCLDTGYGGTYQAGGKFIVLDAGERESLGLTLDNVAGEGLVSFVHVQGIAGGPRVRGIRIMPNCTATRVFYGLTCLNNGDDVSGGFSTFNCARSYFPYGVNGHDLDIKINHRGAAYGPIAETSVLIKSYGPPTSDIRLDVTFSGVIASTRFCVLLEHQHGPGTPASIIEDVDLRITVAPGTDDPNGVQRLALRSYAGDAEEVGRSGNIWRRIRLGGDLGRGGALAVYSRVVPVVAGDITIARGTVGAGPGEVSAPGFQIRREN
jgi:hypothetical protein